jgi:hypothetical protein
VKPPDERTLGVFLGAKKKIRIGAKLCKAAN